MKKKTCYFYPSTIIEDTKKAIRVLEIIEGETNLAFSKLQIGLILEEIFFDFGFHRGGVIYPRLVLLFFVNEDNPEQVVLLVPKHQNSPRRHFDESTYVFTHLISVPSKLVLGLDLN